MDVSINVGVALPKAKKHPSRKLLKQLKAANWQKKHDGLFWQSPHNGNFFAPAGAVAEEKLRKSKGQIDNLDT